MKTESPNIRELWKAAQFEERKAHHGTYEAGLVNYRDSYRQYFKWLDTGFDQEGKTIIEIGPADFPALAYCTGFKCGHIIEPMPSHILDTMIRGRLITLNRNPVEDMPVIKVDEVWILNVYQHVIDPDRLFEYAKECGDVVRFFEPIDLPLDVCHLHSFSLDDFRRHFGDCVKHYIPDPSVKNFHGAQCAYGVWHKYKTV